MNKKIEEKIIKMEKDIYKLKSAISSEMALKCSKKLTDKEIDILQEIYRFRNQETGREKTK